MSFILDALKRSEQEREIGRLLETGDAGKLSSFTRQPIWPLVIGSALLLIVLSTAMRLWWDTGSRAPAVESATPVVAAPSQTITSQPAYASREVGAAEPVRVSRPSKPGMRALAEQARMPRPQIVREKIQPSVALPSDPIVIKPVPVPDTRLLEASQMYEDPASLPFLRQMPKEFRRKLPDMMVNVHLYSMNEAENLVYINNRQYRRGERVEGKVRLEGIVEEGVVMDYEGVRFKLPRPN